MNTRRLRCTLLAPAILLAAISARGGTIAGRIVDANGKPVAASRVTWVAYRADDELLLQETEGTTPAVLGEARTDEAGRFQATLEKPGLLLSVRVITPELPEARLAGPYDSGDATDLSEIRLPNAAKISGRVTDEAGKPVAGALVTVVSGVLGLGDGEAVFLSEARSGADGSFAMINAPEGPRGVGARAPGFAVMSRFAFEERANEAIALRRGGVVRGILTDASGKSVEGAIVTCEDSAARTDATGAYRLAGVPYGSRTVETVFKDDFAARKEAVKVPRDGEAEAPLKLARAAAVAGSVIEEASRKPIAGVRLSILNPGMRFGRRRAERVVRTDGKGRFRAGGLGARHYTVEAFREGYLPSSIPNVSAAIGSPGSVAIALQRAATLAGLVKDEKGQPVGGARVRIQRDPNLRALMRGGNLAAAFGQQSALTGLDGVFVLKGLTAQRGVVVEASKTGFALGRQLGVSWKTGEQVKGLALVLKRGLSAKGKVVDAQNVPLPGAEIYTARRDLAGGRGGGMMIQMAGAGPAGARPDALSGADGTFTVTGLDEGEYTMAISREGYARKTVSSLAVKASEDNVWPPVVLAAGVAVSGSIHNTAGQPVIGAQILAMTGAGRPVDASTDGNGGFRIGGLATERPLMLSINADGYATVQRNVTPPAENLAIVLKTTGTVRGRVEDAATKNPLTDFTIGRTAGGGFGGGFQVQIRNGQVSTGDRAFQSADGTFELTDVPAGKWTMRASASGYRAADVSGIDVGEGETKEGVVLSLKKGGTLTGRVLDPNKGTGVPNASVSWRAQAQGGGGMGGFGGGFALFSGGSNLTATDADGKFSFDGLPEGKVTVTATHPDYLDAGRDVSPDDQASVDITLGIGGSISGTVLGAGGRMPIAGAQVSLDEEGDAANFAGNRTRTDGNGNFIFDHLAAARYKLTAQSTTGNSQPKEVILGENQSQSGVLLEMIVGVRLHGTVTGLPAGRLGGVRITASGPNYSDSATTDDLGQYALKDVPPGVIRLNASTSFMQGRSTTQTVNVDGGTPDMQQDIVFEGVSSLAGRVTRGGAPLGGLFVIALPDAGGQGQRFTAQTDENGSYEMDGMTDGGYQVTVNGQGVNYRKAFSVSGATSGDIVLPGLTVSGTIVDAGTSQPIEGATIQAETGRETQSLAVKRGVTDSTGRYSIDDLDAGSYQVSARKTGYLLKTQSTTVGSDPAQLDFSLQPGTGVQIRVLDGQTGTPLHVVFALAFGAGGSVASQGTVSLDATGTGEIPSLPAGRYSIYIFSNGYAQRVFPAVDVPAPLLTVTMTPGGRVDVTTSTAVIGRIVDGQGALYLLGPFNLTGRVSPQPPITSWQHLAPGSYNLYVQTGGGEKAYPFTVVEGRITSLQIN